MRRLARTVALVVPLLAALACGGRVGLIGDGGGPGCPAPSVVASGAACTSAGQSCPASLTVCGSTESAQCTCSEGAWSCPPTGGHGCVVPTCPETGAIQPGGTCDLASEAGCSAPYTYSACGGEYTTTCTCEAGGSGGLWNCGDSPQPECPDAQPPGCPDPSYVTQGGSCSVSPQMSCTSDIPIYDCAGNYDGDQSCQCFDGTWSCITSEPDCVCPDPETVEQGVTCFAPGSQCPGNPQYCDGAIFYDAFECEGGQWNDVATTGCAGSGSGGSSGSSSGGEIDAGAADAKGI